MHIRLTESGKGRTHVRRAVTLCVMLAAVLGASTAATAETYALVVGIGEYWDSDLSNSYADNDARVMAQVLEVSLGIEVTELTEDSAPAATRQAIADWFAAFGDLPAPDPAFGRDTVIVFLAGHGGYKEVPSAEDGRVEFFMPVDAVGEPTSTGPLLDCELSTVITEDDLADWTLRYLQDRDVIFLLDACYSGGVARGEDGVRGEGMLISRGIIESGRVHGDSGRTWVLASCSATEESWTDTTALPYIGAFTKCVVTGLQGAADSSPQDGVISVNELAAYVQTAIVQVMSALRLRTNSSVDQTPFLTCAPPRICEESEETQLGAVGQDGDGFAFPVSTTTYAVDVLTNRALPGVTKDSRGIETDEPGNLLLERDSLEYDVTGLEVVLEMEQGFVDGPGADVYVHGSGLYEELELSVSEDGTIWEAVDTSQTTVWPVVGSSWTIGYEIADPFDGVGTYVRLTTDSLAGKTFIDSVSARYAPGQVSDLPELNATPAIEITVPSAGTIWEAGTMVQYSWDSTHIAFGFTYMFTVEYSVDGGSTWTAFAGVSNDGSDTWTIPADIDSDSCRLRMTSRVDPSVQAISSEFVIRSESDPRTITISFPTASTVWEAGSTVTPRWTSENIGYTEKLKAEISHNGGQTWNYIGSRIGNDGTMTDWTVPDVDSEECLLRLTSVETPTVYDVSEMFTITPPEPVRTLAITTPSSSTTWEAGTTQTICWTSENAGTPLRVEYSTDGGSTWTTYSSSTGNDGTEQWSIPGDIDSDQCRVRLASMEYPGVAALSSAFTIAPPEPVRTLTITTPTGSTVWEAGSTVTPRWTSENIGYTEKLKAEYSVNGGSSWTLIGTNIGNDGTMTNWTVPDADSSYCLLRLTSVQTPDVYDVSEMFTIYRE